MLYKRVIPCLLLRNEALVKTVKFKDAKYIGDPINTVRIFNEKEVDELIFLDIEATKTGKKPPFKLISKISRECFMPFAYGGGITCIEDADKLFELGVEKISLNTSVMNSPSMVSDIARKYGNQSIIVSIDVKKDNSGKYVIFSHAFKKNTNIPVNIYIKNVENLGAGEILLTSVDNDGVMGGYDLKLVKEVVDTVSVPVIANGGAGSVKDIENVLRISNASAAALGSMIVYQGKNKAVLINFPGREELNQIVRTV